jgi:hypothetical protein
VVWVSYEIPLPMPDELQKKPIKSASDVHKYLESRGFKPYAVVVDNANAKMVVYFEQELSDRDKKALYEAVMEFYRKWVGVEK